MKLRANKIIALELPMPYSLYPDLHGEWIVFEDRYISLGDTVVRGLTGTKHKVIEVFGFEEEINRRLLPSKTVHRQAIQISGKCSPKVGEIFYVNNFVMSY